MKVTLIRHGRPAADLTTRITGHEFAAWLAAYDQAGLDPAPPPPDALAHCLTDCRLLLTSPTRRARESAHQLASELASQLGLKLGPEVSPDAVEVPLPASISWPFPARPTTLVVIARILWVLRVAHAKESATLARLRAQRLARHLNACSAEADHVALVGHGYMHIFTRRALENLGWKRVRAQGHGYWSCSQFER